MDAHSWWPMFENIPTEYLETYYPLTIESYGSRIDTGGAGLHRGGNGVEKVYRFEVDGSISIHDDRERSQPWGILGGLPGACSEKILIRKDGTQERLPSKISNIPVLAGDKLVYRTAGGGGWKDPLERAPAEVRQDVLRQLVSRERARTDYGVVLDEETLEIDEVQTTTLRAELRAQRGPVEIFTFGPTPALMGVCAV